MPLEGVRILLVTRDRPVHDTIRTLCSQISPTYRGLEWAGSYRAALDALENGGVDVCILDDSLLNGSGLELLREPSLDGREIPVILLLEEPPPPDEDPLSRPGVADWIVKSALDLPSLQRALRHARGGRGPGAGLSWSRRVRQELILPDPRVLEAARQVSGLLAPIADRERILHALRGRHDLMGAAVDAMEDALFVKDEEGRYVMMNQAATDLAGLPMMEVLGRSDEEIFEPATAAALRRGDTQVLETGEAVHFDERLEDPDGHPRTVRITKGALRNRNGTVLGLYGVARDVTEQRSREARLRSEKESLERRVVTLQALLGVESALREPGVPLAERLERIAGLVCEEGVLANRPTEARIVLHQNEFRTRGFDASASLHRVPIRSGDGEVGVLEVAYGAEDLEAAEGVDATASVGAAGDPEAMAELLDRIARELGTVPAIDDQPN